MNPSRQDKQKLAEASKSIALIVDDSITSTKRMEISGKILIRVASPRYVVGLVGEHFFLKSFAPGVHKSAVVSNHAAIQESAYVGAHTRIGDCVIGRNSVIHDSVTISDSVIIGDNTQIFPGAVLGTDGLGCTRDYQNIDSYHQNDKGAEPCREYKVILNLSEARSSILNSQSSILNLASCAIES